MLSMSDDLREQLKTVDGIGDAKADELMAILGEYDTTDDPYVQKARKAADAGEYHEAGLYLSRAGGA